jgi:hypothetical protein
MHPRIKQLVAAMAVGALLLSVTAAGQTARPIRPTDGPPPPEVGECRNPPLGKARILITWLNVRRPSVDRSLKISDPVRWQR